MVAALERGFRIQGAGTRECVAELVDGGVVHDGRIVGHIDARRVGLLRQAQLVAERQRRGRAHAGQREVLAHRGGHLEIELVERHDQVDALRAREPADRVQHVRAIEQIRHVAEVVDRVARPRLVLDLLDRQQDDARALVPALAQEILALEVARHAEDGRLTHRLTGSLSVSGWPRTHST